MAGVELRRISNTVSDGPGQEREEETVSLGTEIDGVFFPFVTKTAAYVDAYVASRKDAADAERESKKGKDSGASGKPDRP